MLFKLGIFLLFAVSVTANFFLWQYWKFAEQPLGLTLLLFGDTLVIGYLLIYPLYYLKNFKSLKGITQLWIYRIAFFFVVLATIVLGIDSLWWMRLYLIPIQILLVVVNGYLFFKRRGWLAKLRQ